MPDPLLLEAFPTPAREPLVIEHVAEEFTSLCPKTGHPDYGTITLRYRPAPPDTAAGQRGCVELKSLKLYYQSFRNEGIFYEAVTDRIRADLTALMSPVWLQVITNWRGRGGIRSAVRAEFGSVPDEFRAR
ncbi:MAG: NADPH-dependent 7-cyano-7-deazaguanine reductase QueF [Phycisphaerae bacterium]|nr:NADPH-dependent 7-cyano-7-deazaguanine reductase QueF [Phycisphaerae bacterium]